MIRAAVLAMVPLAAQAGGWDEFQARCVDSYENLSPPVLAGLAEVVSQENQPRYRVSLSETLVIELEPEDGETACRLEDRTGAAEALFDAWISDGVDANRYSASGENSWLSHEWVEPRVGVQKWWDGKSVTLRILVTDLES